MSTQPLNIDISGNGNNLDIVLNSYACLIAENTQTQQMITTAPTHMHTTGSIPLKNDNLGNAPVCVSYWYKADPSANERDYTALSAFEKLEVSQYGVLYAKTCLSEDKTMLTRSVIYKNTAQALDRLANERANKPNLLTETNNMMIVEDPINVCHITGIKGSERASLITTLGADSRIRYVVTEQLYDSLTTLHGGYYSSLLQDTTSLHVDDGITAESQHQALRNDSIINWGDHGVYTMYSAAPNNNGDVHIYLDGETPDLIGLPTYTNGFDLRSTRLSVDPPQLGNPSHYPVSVAESVTYRPVYISCVFRINPRITSLNDLSGTELHPNSFMHSDNFAPGPTTPPTPGGWERYNNFMKFMAGNSEVITYADFFMYDDGVAEFTINHVYPTAENFLDFWASLFVWLHTGQINGLATITLYPDPITRIVINGLNPTEIASCKSWFVSNHDDYNGLQPNGSIFTFTNELTPGLCSSKMNVTGAPVA